MVDYKCLKFSVVICSIVIIAWQYAFNNLYLKIAGSKMCFLFCSFFPLGLLSVFCLCSIHIKYNMPAVHPHTMAFFCC